MALRKPPSPVKALVSAATKVRIERLTTGQIPTETWQQSMWAIYDVTPEVHYGLNFKRASASKMRYFAAEWSDDPEAEPVPTENRQVIEAVERLDQGQGLEDMVGESMIHLDVAGEELVIGRGFDRDEEWAAWSPLELASNQQVQEEMRNGTAVAYRIWRPHPRDGRRADSPLRAVEQVAEELANLSSLGLAQARSRIPAKILVLAQDMMLIQDGSNPNPNDSIAEILGKMMIQPITDPSSAGAVAPIVIEAPRDMVGQGTGWDVIDLARDIADLSEREERLIRRLAAGLDLPAEVILGMAEMNHWSAWLVDEASIKTHVDPTVRLVIDGLTRAYLRPMLEEMRVPDPDRYLIWRDYSALVQHPDRSSSALELYDRAELKGETLRQVHGFGDEDEPDDEERERILANLGKTTTELIDASTTREEAPELDGPIVAALPAPKAVTLSALADVDDRLLDSLTEATEAAVQKAMERAGARLRNQNTIRSDKTLTASIQGVDNRLVPFTLGQRLTYQLVPEGELVGPDDFKQLGEQAERILSRGQDRTARQLEQLGATPPSEQERRSWLRRAVDLIVTTAVTLTTRRLFTPNATPDPVEQDAEAGDVNVPAADMWNVLTVAGGGEPGSFQPDQPRGLALGPEARERIAQAGYTTEAYEWRYGDPGTRRTNFPPHEALNGTRFTSWTAEALVSYTTWLAVTHYYPGDHRGCRCQAVPVVINTAS